MIEKKIKYLEFLQAIINRMAECSFKCKEFCIVICSAILAVYASIDSHPHLLILMCDLPILIFWFLDSFYLRQEKGFRNTYNEKAKLNGEHDFDDFTILPNVGGTPFFKVMFSKTIWPLYFILFFAATASGVALLII